MARLRILVVLYQLTRFSPRGCLGHDDALWGDGCLELPDALSQHGCLISIDTLECDGCLGLSDALLRVGWCLLDCDIEDPAALSRIQ